MKYLVCVVVFLALTGQTVSSSAETVAAAPTNARILPEAVILQFIEKVEAAGEIEAEDLYQAQLHYLIPVVAEVFDMKAMSGAIVGRTVWRDWSDEEQAKFADIMTKFLAATITGRLEFETNGPTIIQETREGPRGTKVVPTLVVQGGEDIQVDYRLAKTDRGWAIVDIVADAKVSEVALRRAEFLAIIRNQGHAGIIAAIGKKLQQLEQTGT